MDATVKQAWIEALRSEDYEQGFDALAQPLEEEDWAQHPINLNGCALCALGVLAVVMMGEDDFVAAMRGNIDVKGTNAAYVAGLSEEQIDEVVHMNDSLRMDFDEIAEVVEAFF